MQPFRSMYAHHLSASTHFNQGASSGDVSTAPTTRQGSADPGSRTNKLTVRETIDRE